MSFILLILRRSDFQTHMSKIYILFLTVANLSHLFPPLRKRTAPGKQTPREEEKEEEERPTQEEEKPFNQIQMDQCNVL